MALGYYMTALLVAPLLYLLLKALRFVLRMRAIKRALDKFPQEDYHWLLGHLGGVPIMTHEGLLKADEMVAKYPRCLVFQLGPLRPTLLLNHPDTVKQLARTAEPKALSGGGGYALLLPWIGEGLLISSGKKWMRSRKLLTPAFHFDVLKPYMSIYNNCADLFLENLNKLSTAGQAGNSSVEIQAQVTLCTLDIILRCAFSTKRDIQCQGQSDAYVNNVLSLSKQIIYRGIRPYLYMDSVYYRTQRGKEFKANCDFSHDYVRQVITEHRLALTEKDQSRDDANSKTQKYYDFLDILLLARDASGLGLTDAEILDEVETFMFEGHDTTSSAITWTLYNLATHPEIQSKAREEVDKLFESRDSNDIMWDDLNQLPYVSMCIKESLRLHPPVNFVSRELTQPMTIDGKHVPKGSFVDINIWNVHHNPTVWSDPLTYDPLRFTPEKMKTMDSHAFIPFSAGPRNCIGQNFAMHELKVVIARVLREFEFSLDETVEVRFKPELVLRAQHGINLHFRKRQ